MIWIRRLRSGPLAQASFDRAVAETNPQARITEEKIAAFVEVMRETVLTGGTPFRRAYIRSVINQVEVDDTDGDGWRGSSRRSAQFCSERTRQYSNL